MQTTNAKPLGMMVNGSEWATAKVPCEYKDKEFWPFL